MKFILQMIFENILFSSLYNNILDKAKSESYVLHNQIL